MPRSFASSALSYRFLLGFLVLALLGCAQEETRSSGASGGTLSRPTSTTAPPASTTTTTSPPPTSTTTTPTTTTTTTTPDIGIWPLSFEDPRGDAFSGFQADIDRGDPLQRLERFCLPSDAATVTLRATEPGITDDAVQVVHLRTRLEDYARIGFDLPVGDVADMVEAFVGILNDECGGIHGRRLDLRTVEVTALGGGGIDIDTLRSAACLEVVDDHDAVLVLDLTGLQGSAPLCLAGTERTPLITTEPHSSDDLRAARGRLLSTAVASDTQLELAARAAAEQGLLEGQVIAAVVSDTPGHAEAVTDGLLETLDDLGLEAAVHPVGCEGTTSCWVGLEAAVSRMVENGTTVVFPVLNAVSLPGLVTEMLRQDLPRPRFVQTGLNGQSGDLAAAQVVAFGGPDAGAYYAGAFIVDAVDTGVWRLSEPADQGHPDPFAEMCNAEYARVAGVEPADPTDPSSGTYQSTAEACALVRIAARVLRDAGANPRQADVNWMLYRLDEVDLPRMLPTSSSRRKNDLPDVVRVLEYQYPCRLGTGTGATGDDPGGCIVPSGDWQVFR